MPNLILSTCGTSLLTNRVSPELSSLIRRYSNASHWNEVAPQDAEHLQQHISERSKQLLDEMDLNVIREMSAELNGLLTWQLNCHKEHANALNPADIYYLLATDTLFGRATADIIQQWLSKMDYQVQIITSSGLKTSSLAEFRAALGNLSRTLVELLEGYKKSGYHIYFNLTGGFKSLNGFLQAISTLYADATFYLFESSAELMFIPRLPLRLDARDIIEQHLTVFRRLGNPQLSVAREHTTTIADSLLFELDGQVILSEWGELLWQSTKPELYNQAVLPSISEQIIYGEDFVKSCADLPRHLMSELNDTIDQLAAFAESDGRVRLNSLDAKSLTEQQYRDQNMWECDIDGKHYRIFMIKSGNRYILQKAGAALHKSRSTI